MRTRSNEEATADAELLAAPDYEPDCEPATIPLEAGRHVRTRSSEEAPDAAELLAVRRRRRKPATATGEIADAFQRPRADP